MMSEILDGLAEGGDNSAREKSVGARVAALTARFPIYQ